MQDLFAKIKKSGEINITANSKEIEKGGVFVARIGATVDGHAFIDEAIEKGAIAVIYSKNLPNLKKNILFFQDENLEENLPNILKIAYDLPEKIVAITGTNGKTSTAFLAASAFSLMGSKSGFIGTLGALLFENGVSTKFSPNSLTTPDIITIYKTLNDLKKSGAEFVFLEASSIGLEQGRLDGLPLSAGAFTNFTQDHLDYHKTMSNYFDAKALLFSKFLNENSFAVLNASDKKFSKLAEICKNRNIKVIDFNTEKSNVFSYNVQIYSEKITFDCNLFENCTINLSGKFQLENILCVIALAFGFGLNLKEFKKVLPKLYAPSGRLELVKCTNTKKPKVFVDYAHTPDSILKALQTLRQVTPENGKLFVLFGCGGDRDKTKRPIMGRISAENADFIIVTDDNPRTENSACIRQEILDGIAKKNNILEIEDRSKAIQKIIAMGGENDVILIAGKGHEDYQIIGTIKHSFNDIKIAEFYLNKS